MAIDDKSIDRYSSRKLQRNNNIVVGTDFLETNKADRAMLLLKCPLAVTRALSNSPDYPSRPAAKFTISVDPLQSNDHDDDSSATEFTMELAGSVSENALRAYSLNMSTHFIPMFVFSESRQGKVTVEGKILNKFDMKPHKLNFERYRKVCRERTHESKAKSRRIQVIDHVPGGHMRPILGMDEKKKVARRVRKESGELERIIFRLFERQPYWTLKQLIQQTNQPEQYMKEILKKLCVPSKKGVERRTYYELKPQNYNEPCEETKPQ